MSGEAAVPRSNRRALPAQRRASATAATAAGALVLFALGAFAPPLLASEFVLRIADEGLLLGLLALSVAFLMSEAGLVSLGAAGVYGGAGYLFAIATSAWDLPPVAALAVALGIVALYALAFGALIVRATPLAFMMLTLAAGEMISHGLMLEALRDWTSGADGLVVTFRGTALGLAAADFASPVRFWPIAWGAAWAAGLALFAVRRSRFGAVLRGIRENEERMRFSGFDTFWPRLAAFVLVNVVAGACGLLHVLNAGFVSPESLGLGVGTNALVAALIGGTAGSAGPIAGGLIFAFAEDEFGAHGFTQLLTGVAIVVFIVVLPHGVAGAASALRRAFTSRSEAG